MTLSGQKIDLVGVISVWDKYPSKKPSLKPNDSEPLIF